MPNFIENFHGSDKVDNAKSSDTIYIVDIWDTKMCPENLKRRIR